MAKIRGTHAVAQMLQGYGTTHVFYVPAVLLRSLATMEGMGIQRVMAHGEKAAAYMADGYARASGRPGVCLAQQIGASNLAAGLRDPFMACSPVIAITGGTSPATRYRNAYQEVEDFSQFDAVTKFNARIDDVARIPSLLRQAFRAATSGTPRPVHLQFRGPHGQVADAEGELEPTVEPQFARVPAFRPAADPAHVKDALARLARARRPIIVAGGGVMASRAQAELVLLAETLGIPVATSLNAKETILDNHPLAVGVVGTYSRACANRAVSEADLVFFVGSQTGGQVTVNWQIPAPGTDVIQLDIAPEELGRNYPNAVRLLGDAKTTLQQLIAQAERTAQDGRSEWRERVGRLVREWRAEAEPLRSNDATPMRPERICREISDALPPDGIVVSDTGHSGMWTGAMIELQHASQRYIRCAGSMGWGFPGALGVKCAAPLRPVLCFTGDGAFYYHLAELETAARSGINLVVLVNSNSSMNQEIPLWIDAYDGKRAEKPDEVWRFQQIDFSKVAESLGCIGMRVERAAQLRDALAEAFKMKRPVVIDAVSDASAFAKKAWTPGGKHGH